MWVAKEEKEMGEIYFNLKCDVGWLVLFGFILDYLRQDSLCNPVDKS